MSEWNDATTLPPDGVEVLCELKPLRKNAKRRRFTVGCYHIEKYYPDLSGWANTDGFDIDVIYWQPITPKPRNPA